MIVLTLIILMSASNYCIANNRIKQPIQMTWPFQGMFGSFDRQSAQRGAQVYFEVCSACHGLNHVYYRNLIELGFSEAEIKEIAGGKTIRDGPDDKGEMFDRKALPSDRFVSPYLNESAARDANNGAYPVDLSLIVKARQDGANYLYSLLTGYEELPNHTTIVSGLHYNPYFEGGQLAMPPPLFSQQVDFIDGTPATIEQMARDVTIFLQWASEPEMEHRKSMGLKVMLFLCIFTLFFFIVNKRVWKNIH